MCPWELSKDSAKWHLEKGLEQGCGLGLQRTVIVRGGRLPREEQACIVKEEIQEEEGKGQEEAGVEREIRKQDQSGWGSQTSVLREADMNESSYLGSNRRKVE